MKQQTNDIIQKTIITIAILALSACSGSNNNNISTTANQSDEKISTGYSLVPNAKGGTYDKTECVKDNATGLIWEGKPTTGLRDATERYTNENTDKEGDASAFVAAVNMQGLCGYNDWRLPTVQELVRLVDYSKERPAIDVTWFPNTKADAYWTSTPYTGEASGAWYLDFLNGKNGMDRNFAYHVRLVR